MKVGTWPSRVNQLKRMVGACLSLPSPLASSFLACTSCVPSPMSSHPLPTRDRRTRAIEVLVSRGYAPSFLFQQSRDPFLLILSSPFLFVLLLFFFFFPSEKSPRFRFCFVSMIAIRDSILIGFGWISIRSIVPCI